MPFEIWPHLEYGDHVKYEEHVIMTSINYKIGFYQKESKTLDCFPPPLPPMLFSKDIGPRSILKILGALLVAMLALNFKGQCGVFFRFFKILLI